MTTLKFKIHKKILSYMGCWFKTGYTNPTYFYISSTYYKSDPKLLSFTLLQDLVKNVEKLHKLSKDEFEEELINKRYEKVSHEEIIKEMEKLSKKK